MFANFKGILNNILYTLHIREQTPLSATPARPEEILESPPGTNGQIKAEALMAREGEKLVLVIDTDLKDIPSWVEWDVGGDQIGVAQSGGAFAQLKLKIPPDRAAQLKLAQRLLLITKTGSMNIAHHVPFIVRP